MRRVFHLSSRAIYRIIGHENLRHRRSHQIDYVKTKLLGLDYVLQNPTLEYFPTEEEKVHLFTKVLSVPMSALPAKAYRTPNSKTETLRYFVDKYPLFLSEISPPAPVVHFTYVDPGPYTTIVDFLNHLRSYAALFARMDVIRMLYIHQVSNKWKQAQDLFHAFVRSGCKLGARRSGPREVLPVARSLGVKTVRKGGIDGACCFSTRPGKSTQELDMRGCIANGKTEIGFFRLEKRRCQPLRLRPTRSVNRMLLSVILD